MSLKKEYTKSTVGKTKGGPGGWKCSCCNPYSCHPRNMKALARRRVRRVGRMELQEAVRVDTVEADRAADDAYEMDRYYQELEDQELDEVYEVDRYYRELEDQEDDWQAMERYYRELADQRADEVYEMDHYYRELNGQGDIWKEMQRLWGEDGNKVCV